MIGSWVGWRRGGLTFAMVVLQGCLFCACWRAVSAADPAEGFGALSKGGSGGRIMVVTTLADAGPGSLRAALAADGPRVVQFAVEGVIRLDRRLRVSTGRITIDGGTAPGDGITLVNHGIHFVGDCDDIIVRDLRIRVFGGEESGDCLLFWGNNGGTVERVLVDHCSLMWATDEVFNTWGQVKDLTCQWSIIAEGRDPHSKAWLSGSDSDRFSIHHCLFAHNVDRNPKLQGGTYDLVNNLVFNWGNNNGAKLEAGARVNLVNNCFIPGPQSAKEKGCLFPTDPDRRTQLYLSGNIGPFTPRAESNQWDNVTWYEQKDGKWISHRPAPLLFRRDQPFAAPPITTLPAQDVLGVVLSKVGAKVRDADDARVLDEVEKGLGRSAAPASSKQ